MGSMLVGLRVSRDVGIDIRNSDLYLYLPVLAGFAVFQLVEVHGVVVVYGRPEEHAQVFCLLLVDRECFYRYFIYFPNYGIRKPGFETVFYHRIPCDDFQINGVVGFHFRFVGIRFRT